MSKLVVGCGYVGLPLASAWLADGESVLVTTRSPERAVWLAEQGFQSLVLDVTSLKNDPLPIVDTVVFAVGFDRISGAAIEDVYVAGLRRVLACLDPAVGRVVYISSTGVYGDADGDWIDENSPCQPLRAGGRACLAAEQLLQQDSTFGPKSIILRLAGIYGPGRIPHLQKLRDGESLEVAAEGYLNLIHIDDIVNIVRACDKRSTTPEVYCVSDGNPARRGDFYRYLAELIASPPPSFKPPATGSTQADRARGSKRICNDKLLQVLGYTLLHPDYRAGLRASLLANFQA